MLKPTTVLWTMEKADYLISADTLDSDMYKRKRSLAFLHYGNESGNIVNGQCTHDCHNTFLIIIMSCLPSWLQTNQFLIELLGNPYTMP